MAWWWKKPAKFNHTKRESMRLQEHYLPFKSAAMLALLGFNEACPRQWGRDVKYRRLKDQTTYSYENWNTWNDLRDPENRERAVVDEVLCKFEQTGNLNFTFMYRNVAAPIDIQALDWFREKYEIDVMQVRKSTGSGVTYLCDPVGPGIGDIQLPECKTPNAAVLQCIDYLLGILKPLEGCFNKPVEEEEEEEETCEVGPED